MYSLFHVAASTGQSDVVPIFALIVVGIVGPAIGGGFLRWNTDRTLSAERNRLAATLAAEDQRSRWQAVREVLDRGAVLLAQFQAAVGALKQVAPGELELPTGWEQTTSEVGVFRGQLRLWFDDEDEVVKAFDNVVSYAVWASKLREGIDKSSRPPSLSEEDFEAMRPHFAERIREQVETHRKRYLDSARQHLRRDALSAIDTT